MQVWTGPTVPHDKATPVPAGWVLHRSKRAGNVVWLQEVVDEVGRDATRFIFLTRRADAFSRVLGNGLLAFAPRLMKSLAVIGTAEVKATSCQPETVSFVKIASANLVPSRDQRWPMCWPVLAAARGRAPGRRCRCRRGSPRGSGRPAPIRARDNNRRSSGPGQPG